MLVQRGLISQSFHLGPRRSKEMQQNAYFNTQDFFVTIIQLVSKICSVCHMYPSRNYSYSWVSCDVTNFSGVSSKSRFTPVF